MAKASTGIGLNFDLLSKAASSLGMNTSKKTQSNTTGAVAGVVGGMLGNLSAAQNANKTTVPTLSQAAALNQLKNDISSGNVPNSGSGLIPTTEQKRNDFAGSSITSNIVASKGTSSNTLIENAVKNAVAGGVIGSGVTSNPLEDAAKIAVSGGIIGTGAVNPDDSTGSSKKKSDTSSSVSDLSEGLVGDVGEYGGGDIGGIGHGGGGGYSYPGFQASDAYTQAMDYTSSLLAQMSTGRTSYSDQIDALIKEYQNREKFSYDASTDPLFQQMLAMSMNSGKTAMEDTIGQAAALTGGYGNTYGQAVGNAAYNQYITDAYANLPDYYNLALDAYNMEGEQMLNELDILRDADNTEYGRLVNAYNANYNYASDMYDREYGSYMDALNQSNNDRNFYYGVQQDALAQQNWEKQFEYNASQDALAQQNWQTQFDYNAAQDAIASLGGGTTSYKEPTQTMYSKALEAYATGGDAALMQYYESIPNYSVEDIDAYIGKYGVIETPELKTYTKTKDTVNGLGGIDRNDVVEDQYGNSYKLSELPTDVAKVLTDLKKGESYNFSTGKKVK